MSLYYYLIYFFFFENYRPCKYTPRTWMTVTEAKFILQLGSNINNLIKESKYYGNPSHEIN